jgi:peptide/nickel transport system permease protein
MLINKRRRHIDFWVYIALAVLVVVFSLFAGYFAPYNPLKTNYGHMLEPPSRNFLFGTDQLGRDIFSRILYGGKSSLMLAILVTFIISVLGISLGTIAGFSGGVLDAFVMRISDVLLAFPGDIFILAMISVLGTGLANLIIAMIFMGWTHYARVSRSLVLSIKYKDYIEQARLGGASTGNILCRYIIPNVVPSLLVLITQDISAKLLTIAGLSLLGLGSQPPIPEWGFMLSEGRRYMSTAPWMLFFPGLVIMINVVIFNLLGDSLRDKMDPHNI